MSTYFIEWMFYLLSPLNNTKFHDIYKSNTIQVTIYNLTILADRYARYPNQAYIKQRGYTVCRSIWSLYTQLRDEYTLFRFILVTPELCILSRCCYEQLLFVCNMPRCRKSYGSSQGPKYNEMLWVAQSNFLKGTEEGHRTCIFKIKLKCKSSQRHFWQLVTSSCISQYNPGKYMVCMALCKHFVSQGVLYGTAWTDLASSL